MFPASGAAAVFGAVRILNVSIILCFSDSTLRELQPNKVDIETGESMGKFL